jgi:hypothetical protein
MQPDGSADCGILDSSYGSGHKAENQIGQQADAQPLQSSSNYINTFVPSNTQYTGTEYKPGKLRGSNLQTVIRALIRVWSSLQMIHIVLWAIRVGTRALQPIQVTKDSNLLPVTRVGVRGFGIPQVRR